MRYFNAPLFYAFRLQESVDLWSFDSDIVNITSDKQWIRSHQSFLHTRILSNMLTTPLNLRSIFHIWLWKIDVAGPKYRTLSLWSPYCIWNIDLHSFLNWLPLYLLCWFSSLVGCCGSSVCSLYSLLKLLLIMFQAMSTFSPTLRLWLYLIRVCVLKLSLLILNLSFSKIVATTLLCL